MSTSGQIQGMGLLWTPCDRGGVSLCPHQSSFWPSGVQCQQLTSGQARLSTATLERPPVPGPAHLDWVLCRRASGLSQEIATFSDDAIGVCDWCQPAWPLCSMPVGGERQHRGWGSADLASLVLTLPPAISVSWCQ